MIIFHAEINSKPLKEPVVSKPETVPAKQVPEKSHVPEKIQKNVPEKIQKNVPEKASKQSVQSKQQPASSAVSIVGKKAQEKKVE